jgi:2-C-methyl-D-erythritol 4-phosphate cytidylyltransferase
MVSDDDPDSPHGCAALRPLRGAAVLRWSVATLASGLPDRLLVVAPPLLAVAARHAVQGLAAEVVPVPGASDGHRLRTVLRLTAGDELVLHDPLYPLISSGLAGELAAALRAAGERAAAAVPVCPLTETVKRVIHGRVLETVDRVGLVVTAMPQVYRRPALLAAVEAALEAEADLWLSEPAALPELLLRRGEELVPVRVDDPGPRVTTVDALERVAASLC